MRVSIVDVANRAEVSISTVSRVLNRRDLVNAKTRERVEAAIRELGFRPNAFGRGLMLRRSEVVGLVLPDLHGDFYSEIIRGADAKARSMGYNLVVSSAAAGEDSHSLLERLQNRGLIDGVAVMISEVTEDTERVLSGFRQPVVLMDGVSPGDQHDSVVIDQERGVQALASHLLGKCGVRRVIFLGGCDTNADTQARLAAWRRSLTKARLPLVDEDVYHLDYEFESACRLAADRLDDWADPDTCVVAANDEMAAGVISAAHAAGVTVPDELQVVGFDDTRLAKLIRPKLTTVRVPMWQMGARAIELLCGRIQDEAKEPRRVSLPPALVVRDSCRANGVS
ncbi:MAG: LacI family DNA-binding transcriptional regulator [Phycisphaerales bacterium]|nr:LacI family DNA-binding transcriptional regulator [Phycisphaerales bacterium]